MVVPPRPPPPNATLSNRLTRERALKFGILNFNALSRVSRLLSVAFGGGGRGGTTMPWADATFTTWIAERYQVFHGTERIGIVECDGGAADFPQFWGGSLKLDPEVPDRFREFFRLGWHWIESVGRGDDARTMRAELEAAYGDLWDTT